MGRMNRKRYMERGIGTKGFTLAEMLFGVWILSILAILIISGFRAMKRSLDSMEEQYRSNGLAENLLEVITEEIRYSRNLVIKTSECGEAAIQIAYTSDEYGKDTILKIDASDAEDSRGYLAIVYGGVQKYYPYQSLYNHLRICLLDDETPVFQRDSHENCIVVSFGICNESGEIKATVKDVHIRILNQQGDDASRP